MALGAVVDIYNAPATPPEDYGGDERIGWQAAGVLLMVLGWGFGVVLNLVLHAIAPASGLTVFTVRIFPALGNYAIAAFGLGLFFGAFGAVLWALGRTSPRGPLVLPGYRYERKDLP